MTPLEIVDDAFWLKFAKDRVSNAIASRDEAAGKIDAFLNIAWSIYTLAFVLGTAFNVFDISMNIRVIMALPIIILPISRYLCVSVQLPVDTNFATNVIEKIKEGYINILNKKKNRLLAAKLGAILSVLSIVLAVFLFKTSIGVNEKAKAYFIKAAYNKRYDLIHIQGQIAKLTTFRLSVAGQDTTGKNWSYQELSSFISDPLGRIDTVISSKGAHQNYRLYLSWTDDKKQLYIIKN